MFYYLNGTVTLLDANLAVIDCGGVGYACHTTNYTLARLQLGKPAKLFTYCNIKEDAFDIFGFSSREELNCFELLLAVSGVGPKAALAVLSLLSPEKFALAVCTDDRKTISRANGIGPKTAARIILELKDKLLKENGGAIPEIPGMSAAAPASPAGRGKLSEAVDALVVLGYSRPEALAALKTVDTDQLELEAIIRAALKNLMRF